MRGTTSSSTSSSCSSSIASTMRSSSAPARRRAVVTQDEHDEPCAREQRRQPQPPQGEGPHGRQGHPRHQHRPPLRDVNDRDDGDVGNDRSRRCRLANDGLSSTNQQIGAAKKKKKKETRRRRAAAPNKLHSVTATSSSGWKDPYRTGSAVCCDWRFPIGAQYHPADDIDEYRHQEGGGASAAVFRSASSRGRRVLAHPRRPWPPAALSTSRLLHRNRDGTPYDAVTFLDPRDDLVAALDPGQGQIVLLRVGRPSSSASYVIQQVNVPSLSTSGSAALSSSSCRLQCVQNGLGLAVGLPTGDVLLLSTETGHGRKLFLPDAGANRTAYWTTWRQHPAPMRRYRPHPQFTLGRQWDRNRPSSRYADELVEIWGWNRRGMVDAADPMWGRPHSADDVDEPVLVPSRAATHASWDFCEASALSSSSLVAAHVGEDYVGVKVVDDRVGVTNILVLGDQIPSRPATGVAFCANGQLLATAHGAFGDAPSSNGEEAAVMVWDLRRTNRPADAILPSFPREAAHRMQEADAMDTFTFHDFHTRSTALELPPLLHHQGGLVCLSQLQLERAMLCHRLLPRNSGKPHLASALHCDGWFVEATDEGLCFTDVERELCERHRRGGAGHELSQKPRKRAYEQTLQRLFDGTLTPSPPARRPTAERHERHGTVIPLHLEDRYGCSTSLSSLAVSQQPPGRIVGGTCDGDIYIIA